MSDNEKKDSGAADQSPPVFEIHAEAPRAADEVDLEADSPRHAEYSPRVVAFLDVLGFKDIISRSAKDEQLVRKIHNALTVNNDAWAEVFAREVGLDMSPDDFCDRMTSFSDCVVISVEPDIREIGLLVYIVFKISRQLLTAGFLSRGGVAKGQLYHADGSTSGGAATPMVFGPAFVSAYQFESTHADGPRVILENSVREHIRNKCREVRNSRLTKFLETHIKRAGDGPAYIDIFADFGQSSYYEAAPEISSEVETIRMHICSALDQSADRPLHFKKNASLARQFNKAVQRAGWERYLIDGELLPTSEG